MSTEAINGIFLVAGVLLGGGLSYLSAWRIAALSTQHDTESELANNRRQAYGEFARALKDEVRICRQLAGGMNLLVTDQPISRKSASKRLFESSKARATSLEDIILLGGEDVIIAARVWYFGVRELRRLVLGPAPDTQDFHRNYARVGKARDAFYAAARCDLALDGESTSVPNDELQRRWEDLDGIAPAFHRQTSIEE